MIDDKNVKTLNNDDISVSRFLNRCIELYSIDQEFRNKIQTLDIKSNPNKGNKNEKRLV